MNITLAKSQSYQTFFFAEKFLRKSEDFKFFFRKNGKNIFPFFFVKINPIKTFHFFDAGKKC